MNECVRVIYLVFNIYNLLLNSTTFTSLFPLPLCNVDLESGICQETVHKPESNNESREGRFQIWLFACLPSKTLGAPDSFDVVLYCIVLYCIVLYCVVLYCIVLHCIVL